MNRRRKGKTEQRELRKVRTLGNKGRKRRGEEQSWTNELNGGTISKERRIGNESAKRENRTGAQDVSEDEGLSGVSGVWRAKWLRETGVVLPQDRVDGERRLGAKRRCWARVEAEVRRLRVELLGTFR